MSNNNNKVMSIEEAVKFNKSFFPAECEDLNEKNTQCIWSECKMEDVNENLRGLFMYSALLFGTEKAIRVLQRAINEENKFSVKVTGKLDQCTINQSSFVQRCTMQKEIEEHIKRGYTYYEGWR